MERILIARETEGIVQLLVKAVNLDPRSSAQIRGKEFLISVISENQW
jgi:hypothetical protein